MSDKNAVVLEGFLFECMDYSYDDNETTVVIRVSGNGEKERVITGWVLELCPGEVKRFSDEINIISCEKRRNGGKWTPAAAQKTIYELSGDIGITGVLFEEWIGIEEDETAVEFKLVLDGEVGPNACKVAYISGPTVYQSMEKLQIGNVGEQQCTKTWLTPIDKPFCLFVVVPEGYKPVGVCKTSLSILKRGVFLSHEEGNFSIDSREDNEEVMCTKAVLQGSVKIIASLPLKSHQACGDTVQATACDCFEVCDTIGYIHMGEQFAMRDVSICPKNKSMDLTLLNAHCGKSVYRLDGLFTIHCKRCEKEQ